MRLHHLQKQMEKTMVVANEVKTGITHLINLIQANAKLMGALPKSAPPRLATDNDMIYALSWCEERVLAINEALMLESSKPSNAISEENKLLSSRQSELATIIMDAMVHKRGGNRFLSVRLFLIIVDV